MKRSILLILALLAVLGAYGIRPTPDVPPVPRRTLTLQEGDLAPSFVLQQVGGAAIDLDTIRQEKKVVVVSFWATWCPSCWIEMLELEKTHQRFNEVDLQILAISSESTEELSTYLELEPAPFPVLVDEAGEVSKSYGIEALPTTLIIDENGAINKIALGIFFSLNSRLASLLPPVPEPERAQTEP